MKIEKFAAKLNDVNTLPQAFRKMLKGGDDITTEYDLPSVMAEEDVSAVVSLQDLPT